MRYESPYEELTREEQKTVLLKRLEGFIEYADAVKRYSDLDLYLKLKEYINEGKN